MNELFPIEPSSPPPLELARQRLKLAEAIYKEASDWEDDTGEAVPFDIELELQQARGEVLILELEALKK